MCFHLKGEFHDKDYKRKYFNKILFVSHGTLYLTVGDIKIKWRNSLNSFTLHVPGSVLPVKSRKCCYILAACGPGLLPNKVSAEQLCAFTAMLIRSWAGLTEDMTPERTEHAVCCHQLSLLLSHGEWTLGFKHVCSCLHQFSWIINVSWYLPPWLACQSNQRRSSLIFF